MTERKAVTRDELVDDEVAAMLAEALTGNNALLRLP